MLTGPSAPGNFCTLKFENHCPAYSGQTQTRGTSIQSLFPFPKQPLRPRISVLLTRYLVQAAFLHILVLSAEEWVVGLRRSSLSCWGPLPRVPRPVTLPGPCLMGLWPGRQPGKTPWEPQRRRDGEVPRGGNGSFPWVLSDPPGGRF